MPDIHRLLNPLLAQTVAEHLKRALSEMGFEGDPTSASSYLISHCDKPALGLWFGLEDARISGIICCVLPTSPLAQSPEIVAFANWGKRQLAEGLIDAAIAFAKDAGYHSMIVCNRNTRGDKIFERRYRKPGRSLHRLGTYWEFRE